METMKMITDQSQSTSMIPVIVTHIPSIHTIKYMSDQYIAIDKLTGYCMLYMCLTNVSYNPVMWGSVLAGEL